LPIYIAHIRRRDPQIMLVALCDREAFAERTLRLQLEAGKFVCATHQSLFAKMRKIKRCRKEGTVFFMQRLHAGIQWRLDPQATPAARGPIANFDLVRSDDDEERFLSIGKKGKVVQVCEDEANTANTNAMPAETDPLALDLGDADIAFALTAFHDNAVDNLFGDGTGAERGTGTRGDGKSSARTLGPVLDRAALKKQTKGDDDSSSSSPSAQSTGSQASGLSIDAGDGTSEPSDDEEAINKMMKAFRQKPAGQRSL
jgi:hypothetical protein